MPSGPCWSLSLTAAGVLSAGDVGLAEHAAQQLEQLLLVGRGESSDRIQRSSELRFEVGLDALTFVNG